MQSSFIESAPNANGHMEGITHSNKLDKINGNICNRTIDAEIIKMSRTEQYQIEFRGIVRSHSICDSYENLPIHPLWLGSSRCSLLYAPTKYVNVSITDQDRNFVCRAVRDGHRQKRRDSVELQMAARMCDPNQFHCRTSLRRRPLMMLLVFRFTEECRFACARMADYRSPSPSAKNTHISATDKLKRHNSISNLFNKMKQMHFLSSLFDLELFSIL